MQESGAIRINLGLGGDVMNKYHRSSLLLIIIVSITIILSTYWLDLEIGYGIILLLIAVGYTIYLNFKALRYEQKKDKQLQ